MSESQDFQDGWVDRVDAAAQAKLGFGPGWHAWIYHKAPQGGLFVTGAVCPPITRGKRKGEPNVSKCDPATKRTVYLTWKECA